MIVELKDFAERACHSKWSDENELSKGAARAAKI